MNNFFKQFFLILRGKPKEGKILKFESETFWFDGFFKDGKFYYVKAPQRYETYENVSDWSYGSVEDCRPRHLEKVVFEINKKRYVGRYNKRTNEFVSNGIRYDAVDNWYGKNTGLELKGSGTFDNPLDELKNTSLDDMDFPVRTWNRFKQLEIKTIGELTALKSIEHPFIRVAGNKTDKEIFAVLDSFDLTIKMTDRDWKKWGQKHNELVKTGFPKKRSYP